jgi:hypothetical protein
MDAAVVLDEAELAKAVHKEANAGSSAADRFGEGFLGDGGDQPLGRAGLAELGHEEEGACKALFAGVEQLVDKVGLCPYAVAQQEVDEKSEKEWSSWMAWIISSRLIFMEVQAVMVEVVAMRRPAGAGDGFFTNELAWNEQGDSGFFAALGNDRELGAARGEIEDGVGLGSLGEEDAGSLQVYELTTTPFDIQKVDVRNLRIILGLHGVSSRTWQVAIRGRYRAALSSLWIYTF